VDFGPVHAWPKPVQRPHPPVYVGGANDTGTYAYATGDFGWYD
jgi:alkanesulfonate monooxygenase SsuD/methylene tetrahydromethanopterin reductase-like flavin-dependent oxidoreductase (luciferase family)